MVIKGKARSGARGLAAHLLCTDHNERVAVAELRGVKAGELTEALREMAAQAGMTRCRRPLYHASINTAPDERLTDAQQLRAIDRLERELGFAGQPRAVIEHRKEGREHLHVVWCRIDLASSRAIPDSHNYRRHETVARELERAFGHDLVPGAHVRPEGSRRPERTPDHAEMQQAERTGLTPQQAKAAITGLWKATGSGKAFAAALSSAGWTLARGDRRDFVLIDGGGGTHSLVRRIEGAKAAEVRERMADLDPASLPGVQETRDRQRQRAMGEAQEQKARAYTLPEGQRALPAPDGAQPQAPRIAQEGLSPEPASISSLAPEAASAAIRLAPPPLSGQARLYAAFRKARIGLTVPAQPLCLFRFMLFTLPRHRPGNRPRNAPASRPQPTPAPETEGLPGATTDRQPVNLTALTAEQRRVSREIDREAVRLAWAAEWQGIKEMKALARELTRRKRAGRRTPQPPQLWRLTLMKWVRLD